MPVLPSDSYDSLIGKFVVTEFGQMLVERIDMQSMRAIGRLTSDIQHLVDLETILDSEVTAVDWHDLEVIEKYLAGEPIVPDVRLDVRPAATPAPCTCTCGQNGGCYQLALGPDGIASHWERTPYTHRTVPPVGCACTATCTCQTAPE